MPREVKAENLSADLRNRAVDQIEQLWEQCQKKFFHALDGSDRHRLKVSFGVTIDTSEASAVIDTEISFKDLDKENGMRVTKTFRKNITEEMDPAQPDLPGAVPAGGSRIKDGEENGEAKPAAAKKKGKPGRPKKERPPISTAE